MFNISELKSFFTGPDISDAALKFCLIVSWNDVLLFSDMTWVKTNNGKNVRSHVSTYNAILKLKYLLFIFAIYSI